MRKMRRNEGKLIHTRYIRERLRAIGAQPPWVPTEEPRNPCLRRWEAGHLSTDSYAPLVGDCSWKLPSFQAVLCLGKVVILGLGKSLEAEEQKDQRESQVLWAPSCPLLHWNKVDKRYEQGAQNKTLAISKHVSLQGSLFTSVQCLSTTPKPGRQAITFGNITELRAKNKFNQYQVLKYLKRLEWWTIFKDGI